MSTSILEHKCGVVQCSTSAVCRCSQHSYAWAEYASSPDGASNKQPHKQSAVFMLCVGEPNMHRCTLWCFTAELGSALCSDIARFVGCLQR
jgi:hypothetical protein